MFARLSLVSFSIAVAVVLTEVSAQITPTKCPDELCFCTESTAKFVCNIPLLAGKCEVLPCTKASCGKAGGFQCSEKLGGVGILPPAVVAGIRAEIEARGGCKGNVCFAIDGSGSINSTEWRDELRFVTSVVSIIRAFPTRVSGVQYNTRAHPIKGLSSDYDGFLAAMNKQGQKRSGTSISAGVRHCTKELKTRPFEPKKLVVLGDGFQNYDNQAVQASKEAAKDNQFLSVVAVDEGSRTTNVQLLLDMVGGDKSRYFQSRSFVDAVQLSVIIRELTLKICQA